MRLRTVNGQLSLASAYKLIFIGSTAAFTLLFWFFALVGALMPEEPGYAAGAQPERSLAFTAGYIFGAVVMTPVFAAAFALVFSGLALPGFWAFRSVWPVTVTGQEEAF